jgi:lambda repressor-like predicted transcriptional regulator
LKPQKKRRVMISMGAAASLAGPGLFSPLARSLLDRFGEAVVLFDPDGRLAYANSAGRRLLDGLSRGNGLDTASLLPRLGRMGGRVERIEAGSVVLGHAVYVPVPSTPDTLAEQERRAIVETLNSTGWKLTETARRLGISRTTLWRRLRAWGIESPAGRETDAPEE